MRNNWKSRGRAYVFGDDVVHDGGIVPVSVIGARITDPDELANHLFSSTRPGFRSLVEDGDFIVGGRNFGCGKPHVSGYIAMRFLGLRLLCDSMPAIIVRATMNLALPCMPNCPGVLTLIADGDELEVDYITGDVINHTTGRTAKFSPPSGRVRDIVDGGGMRGYLSNYLEAHPELRTLAVETAV